MTRPLSFDSNVLIGQCDLISRVSDFVLYLALSWYKNILLSQYE